MVEALHETLGNGGVGSLGGSVRVGEALEALALVTKEVLERTLKRAEASKDEDFDEDEDGEAQNEEADRDDQLLEEVRSLSLF